MKHRVFFRKAICRVLIHRSNLKVEMKRKNIIINKTTLTVNYAPLAGTLVASILSLRTSYTMAIWLVIAILRPTHVSMPAYRY